MTAYHVKWRKGDQITVFEGGRGALYSVTGRIAGAYDLAPQLAGKPRVMKDAEIRELRLDGNLVHYPQAPMGLSKVQYELLSQDFGMHPPEYRMVATIKWEYLKAVDEYRKRDRMRLDEACERAAVEVHAENRTAWHEALLNIERDREAERKRAAHFPEDIRDAKRGDREKLACGYLKPKRPTTIQDWWRLWVRVGRSQKILIPLFADRGNRTPRLTGLNGVDLYEEMRAYLKEHYYVDACPKLTTVHREFKKHLAKSGNGDMVSYNTLNDCRKRTYGPYEEIAEREGKRHARLRLDVAKRIHYDMYAMQEIEIDHCLLDVMLVHETSGRVLRRPWLTMAMCRSTRMIVGVHLSFEEPSAASLQRCLMHAFWPKDLRGLGLKNEWPCDGIPEVVVSDNGLDLHSSTLKSSEMALGFRMRYLPGRMPWLKGTIERCFGRLQIQVLDLNAGKAFLKHRKNSEYDPVKQATMSLPQLRGELLRWIVDDYHVSYHDGIKMTPMERWNEKLHPDGIDSVERPDDLLAIMGSAHEVAIGQSGIRMYGQYYWSEELTPLNHKFGEGFKYQARSDPYDIGHILLIVPKKRDAADGEPNDSGRRIEVWSTTPELAVGVTAYQNRVRKNLSRKLTREGVPVTLDNMVEAARLTDAEALEIVSNMRAGKTAGAAARYEQDNGRLFTPVAGWSGSNRPEDGRPTIVVPESAHSAPPTAHAQSATPDTAAPSAPTPTSPSRGRKTVVDAPPLDAAVALAVEDDFAARFAQMETTD